MTLKEHITIFIVSAISKSPWYYMCIFLDEKRVRHSLCLVCYGFDGTPHPINPKPHGNSKGKQGYVRTLQST